MSHYHTANKYFAESTKSVAELRAILSQPPIPRPKSCQWPTDNPEAKGRKFLFLCEEPLHSGPYCAKHCQIAYYKWVKPEHEPNYGTSLWPLNL